MNEALAAHSFPRFSALWRRFFPAAALSLAAADPADETAFPADAERRAERALDQYGASILRLAYSYLHNPEDAEEILQETLIRFLRKAPVFESPAHEKAWLLRVAGNLSKNRIDYNRVRRADPLNETLLNEQREDLSFLWDAVKELPVPYREVIHLFYYEGCTTAQIARILRKNESTVRSHLHRGRERLKEILKEAYDFGGTL